MGRIRIRVRREETVTWEKQHFKRLKIFLGILPNKVRWQSQSANLNLSNNNYNKENKIRNKTNSCKIKSNRLIFRKKINFIYCH